MSGQNLARLFEGKIVDMSKKEKKFLPLIYFVVYFAFFIALLALLIFRLLNKIPYFDRDCLFLILILVALMIFPAIEKIGIKGLLEIRKTSNFISEASKKDEQEKEKEEQSELNAKNDSVKYRPFEIHEKILSKFIETEKTTLRSSDFRKNMQIKNTKSIINTFTPVFTWYTNEDGKETLYEAKFTTINSAYYNKLYVMLSKIKEYNEESNGHLKLILIFADESNAGVGVDEESINVLKNIFQPAEKAHLLETRTVKINL